MSALRRPIATVMIALMVWLPSALAWASCCAVAMDNQAAADPVMAAIHMQSGEATAAPCHGEAVQAMAQNQQPQPLSDQHADGSTCEHGAACTLATAVVPQIEPMLALSDASAGPLIRIAADAPDAPVVPIDHPPSLS